MNSIVLHLTGKDACGKEAWRFTDQGPRYQDGKPLDILPYGIAYKLPRFIRCGTCHQQVEWGKEIFNLDSQAAESASHTP